MQKSQHPAFWAGGEAVEGLLSWSLRGLVPLWVGLWAVRGKSPGPSEPVKRPGNPLPQEAGQLPEGAEKPVERRAPRGPWPQGAVTLCVLGTWGASGALVPPVDLLATPGGFFVVFVLPLCDPQGWTGWPDPTWFFLCSYLKHPNPYNIPARQASLVITSPLLQA